MSKKAVVSFKIDQGEKQRLIELAAGMGISLSEYCESTILNSCFREVEEDEELLRRPRILSEDDLDAIAGRVALELETLQMYNTRDHSRDILQELPIDEEKRDRLQEYIRQAAQSIGVTDQEVLLRMLVAAYDDLRPGNWNGWSRSVGDYEADDVEYILS
jgi:hypothetical protein